MRGIPYTCPTLPLGGALATTELELMRGGAVVRVIPLEDAATTLGRDLSNRVVLADADVSGHHAVVQRGPDGPTVRDLGSTNGTFVNGEPVHGPVVLRHGDVLGLGPEVQLRVRHLGEFGSGTMVVRDVTAGTLHLVDGDRFRIGADARCDVRLPDGEPVAATLLVHADGETWLGTPEGDRPVDAGDTFEVGGHAFRVELVSEDHHRAPTARPMLTTTYAYELTVTLDAAAGGLALLRDPGSGRECRMESEQRVSLLYLLARQLEADRAARVVPALAGWCHDEDLIVGVWGREALTGAASRYSVLLHRVRKDIEAAELDPWCLEKRRGATRLQVRDIRLA